MYKIILFSSLLAVSLASFIDDYDSGSYAGDHGHEGGYAGAAVPVSGSYGYTGDYAGGDYGYSGYHAAGPVGFRTGYGYTGGFLGLYRKYRSSYSRYFYDYCTRYIHEHPKGRYLNYAEQYLATFRKDYSGVGSVVHQPHGYGYVDEDFIPLYRKYHSTFSRYFYKYCTKYIHEHPKGRYLNYAQKYLATYRGQYSGASSYGYGYSSGGFYSLYEKYRSSYSRYFYDYCNKYISRHPTGPYYNLANQYITRYASRYSGSYSTGYAGGYDGGYAGYTGGYAADPLYNYGSHGTRATVY